MKVLLNQFQAQATLNLFKSFQKEHFYFNYEEYRRIQVNVFQCFRQEWHVFFSIFKIGSDQVLPGQYTFVRNILRNFNVRFSFFVYKLFNDGVQQFGEAALLRTFFLATNSSCFHCKDLNFFRIQIRKTETCWSAVLEFSVFELLSPSRWKSTYFAAACNFHSKAACSFSVFTFNTSRSFQLGIIVKNKLVSCNDQIRKTCDHFFRVH